MPGCALGSTSSDEIVADLNPRFDTLGGHNHCLLPEWSYVAKKASVEAVGCTIVSVCSIWHSGCCRGYCGGGIELRVCKKKARKLFVLFPPHAEIRLLETVLQR